MKKYYKTYIFIFNFDKLKNVRRKYAYFDAIFTLKNTGRASMDGTRHDFAKSAAGQGFGPR